MKSKLTKIQEQIVQDAMVEMVVFGKSRVDTDVPGIFESDHKIDKIRRRGHRENMRRLKEYYNGEETWHLANTAPSDKDRAEFFETMYRNLLKFAIGVLQNETDLYEERDRLNVAEIQRLKLQPFN